MVNIFTTDQRIALEAALRRCVEDSRGGMGGQGLGHVPPRPAITEPRPRNEVLVAPPEETTLEHWMHRVDVLLEQAWTTFLDEKRSIGEHSRASHHDTDSDDGYDTDGDDPSVHFFAESRDDEHMDVTVDCGTACPLLACGDLLGSHFQLVYLADVIGQVLTAPGSSAPNVTDTCLMYFVLASSSVLYPSVASFRHVKAVVHALCTSSADELPKRAKLAFAFLRRFAWRIEERVVGGSYDDRMMDALTQALAAVKHMDMGAVHLQLVAGWLLAIALRFPEDTEPPAVLHAIDTFLPRLLYRKVTCLCPASAMKITARVLELVVPGLVGRRNRRLRRRFDDAITTLLAATIQWGPCAKQVCDLVLCCIRYCRTRGLPITTIRSRADIKVRAACRAGKFKMTRCSYPLHDHSVYEPGGSQCTVVGCAADVAGDGAPRTAWVVRRVCV